MRQTVVLQRTFDFYQMIYPVYYTRYLITKILGPAYTHCGFMGCTESSWRSVFRKEQFHFLLFSN